MDGLLADMTPMLSFMPFEAIEQGLVKWLSRQGVPTEFTDPAVLLRQPPVGMLLVPPVLLVASLLQKRFRERFIFAAGLLTALLIYGGAFLFAVGAAILFTYAYHETALVILQLRLRGMDARAAREYAEAESAGLQTGEQGPATGQPARPAAPPSDAPQPPSPHHAPHDPAAWLLERLPLLDSHLNLLPGRPKFFLALFWLISSAATAYCFVHSSTWFPKMPPPAHFMHMAGLAFLYIKLLSYSRDVLYGQIPHRRLRDVLAWGFFLPTLRMGPIQRFGEYRQMMHEAPEQVSPAHYAAAALRLALGITKFGLLMFVEGLGRLGWKDVRLGPLLPTDSSFAQTWGGEPIPLWTGFTDPASLDGWMLLAGLALQITRFYLFFSGVADVAIGSCRLCGMRLQENFDRPFIASSVADFWRRWHITLGAFCRKDIYIPLGGNRRRTDLNFIAVFAFIGIWHEIWWTFVLWGLSQAVAMVIHRHWKRKRDAQAQRLGQPDIDTLARQWPTWKRRSRIVILVLATQLFAASSFCCLYDPRFGGLTFFESVVRRLVWLDPTPTLAPQVAGWLDRQFSFRS